MPKAILEKEVCSNCGAEVRPDTQFCYSCGKEIFSRAADQTDGTEVQSDEGEKDAVLGDLEKALAASRIETTDSKAKIEAAAAERRRSRSGQRKPLEIVWEKPASDIDWVYLVSVGIIFVMVLLTVLVFMFWK